jgi:hypothetical protein
VGLRVLERVFAHALFSIAKFCPFSSS